MRDKGLVAPKSPRENRTITIDQNTTILSASSDSSSRHEDRLVKIAATVFSLVILGALIGGLLFPAWTAPLVKGASYVLMVIMFGMGLTFAPPDFGVITRRPWPVLVGVLAQYIIMLLVALTVTWASHSDPALAIGMILAGCAPGGTASNAVVYFAKGDIALLVAMTVVSTLLSPLVTPIFTKHFAGQYMLVDAVVMAKSIMMTVLIPVVLDLLLRSPLPKLVEVTLSALPWVSVFGISYAMIVLVGASSTRILSAGLAVLAAVIVHNGPGLAFGYFAVKGLKAGERAVRTTAIEIGMQNSGPVVTLDATYFTPETAVPGAIFSAWHDVSGSALAVFF